MRRTLQTTVSTAANITLTGSADELCGVCRIEEQQTPQNPLTCLLQTTSQQYFLPLIFCQPAPYSIGFTNLKRMFATLFKNGAGCADCFGCVIALTATSSPLIFWVEKQRWICLPTSPFILPIPQIHDRARETRNLGHECLLQ